MSQKHNAKKGGAGGSHGAISDPRFKNFETDPRFRLPSRKDKKVTIDNRFSRMLNDEDFAAKASVDRYGRKLPKGAAAAKLRNKFVVENEDEDEDEVDADEEVESELARVNGTYDPARDGGFDESSSSEDESSSEASSEGEESEDETSYREVEQGLDGEVEGEEEGKDAQMPLEDASARLAVVNLDWDNIRAVDLMAVARSFSPDNGKILSIQVLPSEFGKERMQREETEGPPKELFASTKNVDQENGYTAKDASDSDSDDEDEDDEKIKAKILAQSTSEEANTEVNSSALRKYQLTRLRYYYAVLTCDSSSTALTLYRNMDGREYLSSANFFDLRFIPDEVDFDDDTPRDECTEVPAGYHPNEFVTEALTHSKVKLTWDAEEDKARKETQKRAFKAGEAEDVDVRAYLASDTSDDSEESDEEAGKDKKQNKAEAARAKLRAALGLSSNTKEAGEGKRSRRSDDKSTKKSTKESKPVGDMQITFTAGLSNDRKAENTQFDTKDEPQKKKTSVFVNKPDDVREETTREKYIRKERERKERRKERARARREGEDAVTEEPANAQDSDNHDDEDDPFAHPFFNDPVAANDRLKKDAKKAKRKAAQEQESKDAARKAKERAELELLMADEDERSGTVSGGHFDMVDIKKAEKAKDKKNKGKRGKKGDEPEGISTTADFDMNVKDPRFASLYDSHEFAIDPSHSRFSGTQSMKKVLEEGRKRRQDQREGDEDVVERNPGKSRGTKAKGSEIDELVSKVKKRRVAT